MNKAPGSIQHDLSGYSVRNTKEEELLVYLFTAPESCGVIYNSVQQGNTECHYVKCAHAPSSILHIMSSMCTSHAWVHNLNPSWKRWAPLALMKTIIERGNAHCKLTFSNIQ